MGKVVVAFFPPTLIGEKDRAVGKLDKIGIDDHKIIVAGARTALYLLHEARGALPCGAVVGAECHIRLPAVGIVHEAHHQASVGKTLYARIHYVHFGISLVDNRYLGDVAQGGVVPGRCVDRLQETTAVAADAIIVTVRPYISFHISLKRI